jgi:hypothetical protein
MSEGAICEGCRHYREQHNENGKCQFSHSSINKGEPCPCVEYKEFDEWTDYFKKKNN